MNLENQLKKEVEVWNYVVSFQKAGSLREWLQSGIVKETLE